MQNLIFGGHIGKRYSWLRLSFPGEDLSCASLAKQDPWSLEASKHGLGCSCFLLFFLMFKIIWEHWAALVSHKLLACHHLHCHHHPWPEKPRLFNLKWEILWLGICGVVISHQTLWKKEGLGAPQVLKWLAYHQKSFWSLWQLDLVTNIALTNWRVGLAWKCSQGKNKQQRQKVKCKRFALTGWCCKYNKNKQFPGHWC